jgi:hypothetical protein
MHDRNDHYIGCAHREQRRLILETGGVHDRHVMDFALALDFPTPPLLDAITTIVPKAPISCRLAAHARLLGMSEAIGIYDLLGAYGPIICLGDYRMLSFPWGIGITFSTRGGRARQRHAHS